MIASILAILKAISEILGFGKWIYNESKDTPSQVESKIEVKNNEEKNNNQDTTLLPNQFIS
jgi:hypothetical protein